MRANFGLLFERLRIMKRIIGTALGLCLLAGSQAIAQAPEKKVVETTTKQTGPGATLKSEAQSVTGTVKEYEAGKKIKLSGPDDKSYAFELGEGAAVEGKIVVGQMATVQYTKGTDGKESVTAVSEATANAVTAADAPTVHSESVTKKTGPGADTKAKTEVVIGTVKEYEVGKSIKVLVDAADAKKKTAVGRHTGQAPDIDGHILINDCGDLRPDAGEFYPVEITDSMEYDLIGRIL